MVTENPRPQPSRPSPGDLQLLKASDRLRSKPASAAGTSVQGFIHWRISLGLQTPLDKRMHRREYGHELNNSICPRKVDSGRERFPLDLDIIESGSVCTLKVKGKLVCGEPVTQFENAFKTALSSGHIFLIVDLEAVPFLDSSGIGSIVNALRTSSKVGGSVKLVKPANFVAKTLKMVGVLDLFEVFDSEADAAAACENS